MILNDVRRGEARGTWLESHLKLGLGITVVWLPLAVVTIWLVYRIARGWIRLASRQPMYA